ncbi:MAG: response regulator [Magnetococcales bacterium]|nr:response regulator [Magnetococcales bacterium]
MVRSKKDRHVALVVEDDLEMAEEVKDLLRSMGHEALHVPSREEALELLDDGQFCFVLLDLQIKPAADSIKAQVLAGQTLLSEIRKRYPCRNQDDQHHLQIVVMSGYAKERSDVIKALQNGADDFIVKPLGENDPPFGDKVAQALIKSGRGEHADCPGIMQFARQGCSPNGHPISPSSPGIQLSITGEPNGKRSGIEMDGKPLFLPDAQFLLLMRLVTARFRTDQGWVHKNDLGSQDSEGFRGMSNLNGSIKPLLPPDTPFYENDKKGSYRINPAIAIGRIDHDRLVKHDSREVRKLSYEIKASR